jgi:GNAT superfamily N-acetyltransferase
MSVGPQPSFPSGHQIRAVERSAWLDLVSAAPEVLQDHFDISFTSSAHAAYLAAAKLAGVPFNRAFALDDGWANDDAEVDNGLQWLRANAAHGWVVQIDEHDIGTARHSLLRNGLKQLETGWMKLAISSAPIECSTSICAAPVEDEEDAFAFADVIIGSFGFPCEARDWFAGLADRPGWRIYLVRSEDYACAAGAAFVTRTGSWLGIDATLPEYRGQGFQRALIERRLKDAFDFGSPFAVAETARPSMVYERRDASYRNYLRSGFSLSHYSANFGERSPD